ISAALVRELQRGAERLQEAYGGFEVGRESYQHLGGKMRLCSRSPAEPALRILSKHVPEPESQVRNHQPDRDRGRQNRCLAKVASSQRLAVPRRTPPAPENFQSQHRPKHVAPIDFFGPVFPQKSGNDPRAIKVSRTRVIKQEILKHGTKLTAKPNIDGNSEA